MLLIAVLVVTACRIPKIAEKQFLKIYREAYDAVKKNVTDAHLCQCLDVFMSIIWGLISMKKDIRQVSF